MSSLIDKAKEFAQNAHKDQKRKYTGEPYFVHCEEVANIVRSIGGTDEMIAAAYLHDTVEDCGIEPLTIATCFGSDVGRMVEDLTDVSKKSDGNRATRKEIDRQHLAKALTDSKTIKLADLISNGKDIMANDPSFGKVYLAEKRLLLEVLKDGNASLYERAKEIAYALENSK